jgi:hypothetical protein
MHQHLIDLICGIWTPITRLLLNRSVLALVLAFEILSSPTKASSPVPLVNKVVEEDRCMLLAHELESTTPPDGTTQALGPAMRDAFAIFEDLCLLGNG